MTTDFIELVTTERSGARAKIFLPLKNGLPISIGSGRSAEVFLGQKQKALSPQQTEYVAVKCLLNDQNEQYARSLELRFNAEKDGARQFGVAEDVFITFLADGRLDETKAGHADVMHAFDLRGPLYVMALARCSLSDILDSELPWNNFPAYRELPHLREALWKTTNRHGEDIATFIDKFIDRKAITSKVPSGYEILRAFRNNDEGNQARTYAVLEIALHLVQLVQALHATTDGKESLCHRDLKPGNILVSHGLQSTGIGDFRFLLSDLGGVANENQLRVGEATFRFEGFRTPGAGAPGSEFFRAPEQAAHPREVRVTITGDNATVRGSKLPEIEPGDWIAFVGGTRGTADAKPERYQKVTKVERLSGEYRITLENAPAIAGEEIVAFVVKGTGFHTDGFGIGAMLYDILSGGRNPENFYTYCVRMHDKWSTTPVGSVGQLVDALMGPRYLPKFRVSELLKDTRGVRLPRPVLSEVLRCMTRGLESSYYKNAGDGFLEPDNLVAMNEMHRSLLNLMSESGYPPPVGIPMYLRTWLLLKLRCHWPAADGQ